MNTDQLTASATRLATDLTRIAKLMAQRGYVEASGGNVSLAFKHNNALYLLISASGSRLRQFADTNVSFPDGLVLLQVKPDSWQQIAGQAKPSSELETHLRYHRYCYQQGLPTGCLLHAHPPCLIALSHLPGIGANISNVLDGMLPEVAMLNPAGAAWLSYARPGSDELAQASIDALAKHPFAMWEKHGCLSFGANPDAAYDLIEMYEKAAWVYLLCRQAGINPPGLSAMQIQQLRK